MTKVQPAQELTLESIFKNMPQLETQRLLLRKMRLEDAADMYEYAKDPETARFVLWDSHRSVNDSLEYIRCAVKGYEKGQMENWGIEYKENHKFIGTCGFFYWDMQNSKAEMHYALSKTYWGKGLMTEVVRELIRFGFEHMQLNRIEAKHMPGNEASGKVMQKAGMQYEGTLREYLFAKGKFHDLKAYAILKKDRVK